MIVLNFQMPLSPDHSISTDLACYAFGATALAVAAAQWLFIVLFSGEIVDQYTQSVNHAEHMGGWQELLFHMKLWLSLGMLLA